MNKLSRLPLGLCLLVMSSGLAAAQENVTPSVLGITREFVKPGKAGMVHEKAESAFVQAMTRAKWPTHYLAMTSLSGKPRALFLTHYDSFEAWEKDNAATEKNAALSAALERASVADGELLDAMDQGVFVSRHDLSYGSTPDFPHMRYMQISVYRVRPGHESDWEELVKMIKAAYEKGVPEAHWGTYEETFGGAGGTYLVLTARKTLAEVDQGFADDKKFEAAMGEDGMKRLGELSAASIESSEHQLFAFNPRMSYPPDEWIKADPKFWKPKMAAAPAAKPAAEKKATP